MNSPGIIGTVLAFSLVAINPASGQQGLDLTRVAGTSGTEVTQAAVDAIVQSRIFGDDNNFLRRIAWVESKDGTDANTYRQGYDGGIWQVDLIGFQDTQLVQAHPGLAARYQDIQRVFNINWPIVQWSDLRKPLYSALAARLLLSNIPQAIPNSADINGQAAYWKQYYNTPSGAGTVQKFIDDVEALQRQEQDCNVVGVDLAFVMDGSGSIGGQDFETEKSFVRGVVSGFVIGPNATRVAIIQYSSSAYVEFGFTEYTTNVTLLSAISNIRYRGGGTRTGTAINVMVNRLFGPDEGARGKSLNIPRIGVVITDGKSGDSVAGPANAARAANITMFAIGVGNYDPAELNLIANDGTFVFEANNFGVIDNIRSLLSAATCRVPVTVETDKPLEGTLSPNSVRYAAYPIPSSRMMTLKLETPTGQGAIAYFSTRIRNPNKAFYEWKLETNPTKRFDQIFIDFNNVVVGRRRKRQVITPGATILYSTIENQSTGTDPPGPVADTIFNLIGEEGNTLIPISTLPPPEFPCGPDTPCENGGLCMSNSAAPGTYICQCPACVSGQRCEFDNSGCANNACQNGARCMPFSDSCGQYYCSCPACFYGRFCENRIDACSNHKCQNGAMCVNPQGTCRDYQCVCSGCFSGAFCNVPVRNPCGGNPCQNGGACTPVSGTCYSYQCRCINGFAGKDCEIAPITNLNLCNDFLCDNGGTCVSHHNGTFVCVCRPGWAGTECAFAVGAQGVVSSCSNSPCLNGGTCYDSANSVSPSPNEYTCVCAAGFGGVNCAISTATTPSVDVCGSNPSICQSGGVCSNAYFTWDQITVPFCSCPVGFIGQWCEIQYFDPCSSNPCLNNGLCTPFNTYFVCQCQAGFQGVTCSEVGILDPCTSSPCINGVCFRSSANQLYTCLCNDGFSGQKCDIQDGGIDITPPVIDRCPNNINQIIPAGQSTTQITWTVPTAVNPSEIKSMYSIYPGITRFTVQAGAATKLEYSFTDHSDNVATCNFAISASTANGPVVNDCPGNMQYQLNPGENNRIVTWIEPSAAFGTLTRTRQPGVRFSKGVTLATYSFRSGNEISVCAFIIEVKEHICTSRNPCQNGGQCSGSGTNFVCQCPHGFTGVNCQISNICAQNPCQNGGQCAAVGSSYQCSCPQGFTGINCQTATSPCSPNPCRNGGTCSLSTNGFFCTCPPGFGGEFCQISPCTSSPCRNGATCTAVNNGYTCQCQLGFSGPTCEIGPCTSSPCRNGATCTAVNNGYTCQCQPGYAGPTCEIAVTEGPIQIQNCPRSAISRTSTSTDPSSQVLLSWTTPSAMSTASANVAMTSSTFGGANSIPLTPGMAIVVEYTFTDTVGNSDTCAFAVTASYHTGPEISDCPPNIEVEAHPPDGFSRTVSWTEPTSLVPWSFRPISPGSTFYVGNTLVQYVFGDIGLNPNVCAFVVTVKRNAATSGPVGRKKKDTSSYDSICQFDPCSDVINTTCVQCGGPGRLIGYACVSKHTAVSVVTCRELPPSEDSNQDFDTKDKKTLSNHQARQLDHTVSISLIVGALLLFAILVAVGIAIVLIVLRSSKKVQLQMPEHVTEQAKISKLF